MKVKVQEKVKSADNSKEEERKKHDVMKWETMRRKRKDERRKRRLGFLPSSQQVKSSHIILASCFLKATRLERFTIHTSYFKYYRSLFEARHN